MSKVQSKQSWTQIKQQIKEFSREGLIGLVKDLYEFSTQNQSFLHTRFPEGNADESLDKYKQKISIPFEWKGNRPPSLKIADAKKAITEYKKATGNNEGVLDLKFTYLHSMIQAFDEFGIGDDKYYDSLYTALCDFVKAIKNLGSAELYEKYDKRLKSFVKKYTNLGYGFEDDLEEAYEQFDKDWDEVQKNKIIHS